mmetsp:Transcript_19966/g.55407  ORF Transcript_19966/g.55407 Transcript_19966/m.55407 type:complete len:161 (+) Transcript_19966:124-606(+)
MLSNLERPVRDQDGDNTEDECLAITIRNLDLESPFNRLLTCTRSARHNPLKSGRWSSMDDMSRDLTAEDEEVITSHFKIRLERTDKGSGRAGLPPPKKFNKLNSRLKTDHDVECLQDHVHCNASQDSCSQCSTPNVGGSEIQELWDFSSVEVVDWEDPFE